MTKQFILILAFTAPFFIFSQITIKPRGCFAGTNGTHGSVLAHSDTRGVLLTEKWADIEPTEGVYDFTNLTSKINTVKAAGLNYTIAIAGGAFGSPSWLIDSLNVSFHIFQYQSQSLKLPLWWDTICMQKLELLITQLGNLYASDTMLSHVYVTQMTTNGIEGHLNGVDMTAFATDGFTNQKWIESAKTTTLAFATAFPDKPIVFEVHEINYDTVVPVTIIKDLATEPNLCKRLGLAMWWISGKNTYQANLVNYIMNYKGDKYAQIIGRSDQTHRFKDSLYSSVFTQAKLLNIRYIEPWPYEFQHQTHDSLIQDFNTWADANFSTSDTCELTSIRENDNLLNSKVNVYPNPTSGEINIKIGVPYQNAKIKLFSLNGKCLKTTHNPTKIDMSNFAEGVYYLTIEIDNATVQRKIIKVK